MLYFLLVCSILVAASFSTMNSIFSNKSIKGSRDFYLYNLIVSGAVGVVQKTHQSSIHKGEKFSFLCVTFFIMCIFSLIMYLMSKKHNEDLKINLKTIFFCGAIGIFTAFNHAANLYLSGKLDSMFFFPVFNGAFTVVCFVISILLLKEKLNLSQKLSFVLGIVGIILLGLAGWTGLLCICFSVNRWRYVKHFFVIFVKLLCFVVSDGFADFFYWQIRIGK